LTPSLQLGGFTLTSAVLYLSIHLHAQNRARQSELLSQQSRIIHGIITPQPPAPPKHERHVQAGLLETAKDKWNKELEENVRRLQSYDWTGAFERVEENVGGAIKRAFDGTKDAAREVSK
jgi:altered-inheritance-of-mitochondria protein 5